MGLMTAARALAHQVLTDTATGWGTGVLFAVRGGGSVVLSAEVKAVAIKHHMTVDDIGKLVSAKQARVTVSMQALEEAEYPYRNTNGAVALVGHMVTWADVSGVQATYEIRKQYPDDTLGIVVCELGDYGVRAEPSKVIIGWQPAQIVCRIVAGSPSNEKQTLPNDDKIPVEYVLQPNGTLTVPYLVGKWLLTGFMLDNAYLQGDIDFTRSTGNISLAAYGGGFVVGSEVNINASVPIYKV